MGSRYYVETRNPSGTDPLRVIDRLGCGSLHRAQALAAAVIAAYPWIVTSIRKGKDEPATEVRDG